MVEPQLHSIHQQDCFTCVTLLYLHSNCCSPTLICAQKKRERERQQERESFISNRETSSGGQSETRGLWCSKQTHKEAGRRTRDEITSLLFILFGRLNVRHGKEWCEGAPSAATSPCSKHHPLYFTKSFARQLFYLLIVQLHNKSDNSQRSIPACVPAVSQWSLHVTDGTHGTPH